MINCIIIEDEPLAQQILEQYVEDHPDLNLIDSFEDPVSAMTAIENSSIDLLFLDINLPKLSGINFYKSLSTKPKVIFTTAYSEHAVEGFELEAIDYLLKPFSFARFLKAVNRVKEKTDVQSNISTTEEVLVIKIDKKVFRIPYSDIIYIESMRDFVRIHTEDNQLISSETLKNLELKLPTKQFLRIHKSYIINFTKVNFLEGNQVSINGGRLTIGQSYRDQVISRFKQ